MTIVDQIREVLHHAAGVLVWPVLVSLLALAGGMIVALGAFAREALERRGGRRVALDRDRAALSSACDEARAATAEARAGTAPSGPVQSGAVHADVVSSDIVALAAHSRETDSRAEALEPADSEDLRIEAALQDAERRRWRSVARMRLAIRLGPALGLMGTLIPMAGALQGLADGNLPALASNMVTAFAATVIGLAVSVVAFLISAAREEWVRADIAQLAFHAERLSRRAAARA